MLCNKRSQRNEKLAHHSQQVAPTHRNQRKVCSQQREASAAKPQLLPKPHPDPKQNKQKPFTTFGALGKLNETLDKNQYLTCFLLRGVKLLEHCLASSKVFSNIYIITVTLLYNLMKQVLLLTLFLQEWSHSYFSLYLGFTQTQILCTGPQGQNSLLLMLLVEEKDLKAKTQLSMCNMNTVCEGYNRSRAWHDSIKPG